MRNFLQPPWCREQFCLQAKLTPSISHLVYALQLLHKRRTSHRKWQEVWRVPCFMTSENSSYISLYDKQLLWLGAHEFPRTDWQRSWPEGALLCLLLGPWLDRPHIEVCFHMSRPGRARTWDTVLADVKTNTWGSWINERSNPCNYPQSTCFRIRVY